VPIELLTHVVRDESGQPEYYYAFITDTTERRRAEEALRESEQRLALTLEATNDGMWDWHVPTGAAVFSSRYYTMLGYEPYEFPQTYSAWKNLVHPDDIVAAEAEIDAHLAGGHSYALEFRMRAKTGDWRRILSRGKAVERDGSERPTRMLGTHTDVTELRRAEQATAERSHFLEELLEAIPAPVFYKDRDLRYVGCNEAFAKTLGRSKDQVIGKTVFDMNPASLGKRYDASDRQLLAHPERPQQNETDVTASDGTVRSMVTHKAVFSDVGGNPAGIVGVSLDVTEIRRAEKELAAGAVRLRLALRATVAALGATTEMRDPYTAGHQRRVAELSTAIAVELGWDEGRVETLRTAALLHDTGKIVVPAEILSKPGRLSETEMQLVRQHAAASADTVGAIDFEGDVAGMIRQHHERLDGSGYPAGLRGREILPEARVLAVSDVVEAMASHRPYRPSLPIEEALAEIESGAGVLYDSDAVAACARLFREKGLTLSE
jgi:PAS domain S-box-containing protein/putative nucleotidyltransferase with HDIG domain